MYSESCSPERGAMRSSVLPASMHAICGTQPAKAIGLVAGCEELQMRQGPSGLPKDCATEACAPCERSNSLVPHTCAACALLTSSRKTSDTHSTTRWRKLGAALLEVVSICDRHRPQPVPTSATNTNSNTGLQETCGRAGLIGSASATLDESGRMALHVRS